MDEVPTPQVLDAARGRADFLTLDVDLNDRSGKREMDRKSRGTHAELLAIVDVERGRPVWWTDKSYPVSWQERSLVQEADLESAARPVGAQKQHSHALGGQDAQDGVDDGRLAHARPAGDDHGLGDHGQANRMGLAFRKRQAGLALDPLQRHAGIDIRQGNLPSAIFRNHSPISRSAWYRPPRNIQGVPATVSATTVPSVSSRSRAV